jgi:hypothetical protein
MASLYVHATTSLAASFVPLYPQILSSGQYTGASFYPDFVPRFGSRHVLDKIPT